LINKLKLNKRPITLNSLASYVIQKVQEDTKGKQTPILRPLNIKGDDMGQFILYPKHTFYRFEEVLVLAKESKFIEAVIELKNYCLESKILPKGYEFLICGLKSKLIKIKMLEDIWPVSKEIIGDSTFRLNEIVRELEKYNPIDKNDFTDILNLLSTNSTHRVVDNLKKRFKENHAIYYEVIMFSFRFEVIEKEWNEGLLSINEYYHLYCNAIDLFVLLIINIYENKENLKNTISFADDLLEKMKIPETIKLLDYYLISHFGKCEEWYLLNMLQNRDIENRHKVLLEVSGEESFSIERNRIIHALVYLFERVMKKKTYNFMDQGVENSTRELIIHKFSEVEKLLCKGDIKAALNILPNKEKYVIILKVMLNKAIQSYRTNIFEFYDYYGRVTHICGCILDFFYLAFEIETNRNLNYYEIEKVKVDAKTNSEIELLDAAKSSLANGNVEKAIDLLKSISKDSTLLDTLAFISLRNNSNVEDSLFTKKDVKMINLRRNKIANEIQEIIREIEKTMSDS